MAWGDWKKQYQRSTPKKTNTPLPKEEVSAPVRNDPTADTFGPAEGESFEEWFNSFEQIYPFEGEEPVQEETSAASPTVQPPVSPPPSSFSAFKEKPIKTDRNKDHYDRD